MELFVVISKFFRIVQPILLSSGTNKDTYNKYLAFFVSFWTSYI